MSVSNHTSPHIVTYVTTYMPQVFFTWHKSNT